MWLYTYIYVYIEDYIIYFYTSYPMRHTHKECQYIYIYIYMGTCGVWVGTGYKDEVYLWELVVMCRKGLLSVIGVALAFDSRSQVITPPLITLITTL